MFADNRLRSTDCQMYVEPMLASYTIKMIADQVRGRSRNVILSKPGTIVADDKC